MANPDPNELPDRKCANCDYLANLTPDQGEPDYECRRWAVEQVFNQEDAVWYVGHPKIIDIEGEWCGEFKRTSRPLPIPNTFPWP